MQHLTTPSSVMPFPLEIRLHRRPFGVQRLLPRLPKPLPSSHPPEEFQTIIPGVPMYFPVHRSARQVLENKVAHGPFVPGKGFVHLICFAAARRPLGVLGSSAAVLEQVLKAETLMG